MRRPQGFTLAELAVAALIFSLLTASVVYTFAAQIDQNREPPDVEDLSDSPKPVFTRDGTFIAWTDFHKRDSSAQTPHEMYDIYAATPGKDPTAKRRASPRLRSRYPSPIATASGAYVGRTQVAAPSVRPVSIGALRPAEKKQRSPMISRRVPGSCE